ncbi:hypothetical protein AB0I72_19920 [Nocardiopsis sp. NPDC049922]|uniref:hypothetical protein n=1 Tax=Nocardiopsis sp. NPDC049922 TaxID=3155157 RepID=UPI003410725B
MTPEVLVGLIGAGGALSGALVGGFATFAGVVYQQNRQAEQAAEERRAEMAHHAIDTIITQTWGLKKLLPEWSFKEFEWSPEMDACVDTIRMAALRLPQKDLREPIEAACSYLFGGTPHAHAASPSIPDRPAIRVRETAEEIQRRLGAHLRGEPLEPLDGRLRMMLEKQKHWQRLLSANHPVQN